ncbi:ABC-2 type transport system ATP-binding protein [Kineothrix alysoides]|uniref:ABC-2 type transport system ATP-binding protein n=1 Tax=Kineothrix alysoides TaxID=1469948 RepID=A0A4R1R349_9FIRM|nr:ABC transporter ATP-binding protein [Kineothrix alysoides]TCL59831.1 ABC-2 type transport system ATP-binding protein [Kineothrix alysoides]
MIEINNVSKAFEDILAVDDVSVTMKEDTVFGLIGTNGAGKSTVLRMVAGVMKADKGTISVDGISVYDNIGAKERVFFIADEPYFFANSTAVEMEKYFSTIYKEFNRNDFYTYMENFGLDKKRKINTFSKGMKKQLALLCGICSRSKYLLCDETFDGLDPVMRQGIKSIFAKEMESRGLTPVIASHNLRELEDICDHVGLLHKGGVLLSKDLEDMKCNIQKVQCVFKDEESEKKGLEGLQIMKEEKRGSLYTLTVRGNREQTISHFSTVDTIFFEALPLSLEEIFISETEVVGYDIKKLILS